jgi:AraC-like DNA-binding protein
MSLLERSLFTTQFLAPEKKFPAWNESVGALFGTRLDGPGAVYDFHASVESYLIGSAVLTRCLSSCQKFSRTPARIARDGIDHYMIQIFSKGEVEMKLGQKSLVAPTRTVVGFDFGEVLDSVNSDFNLLSAFIPRTLLAPLLRRPDSVHGVVVDSTRAEGKLFADFFEALFLAAPTLSTDLASSMMHSLIHMAAAALNGSMEPLENVPTALAQANFLRACNFIEFKLSSEDLSPELVAREIGVSRASLYRIFGPIGGIAAYIRQRRLKRAFRMMVSPSVPHQLRISDIAYQVGIVDSAKFSRLFKEKYGLTPSEIRKESLIRPASHTDVFQGADIGDRLYEHWISELI